MKGKFKKVASTILIASMICGNLVCETSIVSGEEIASSFSVNANQVNIIESAGALECIYAKWEPVEEAEGYNVYLKDFTGTYSKINGNLIRKYPNYFRADALGVPAGTYSLKVVPIMGGSENESWANETQSFNVLANDRSGFAHSDQSPAKTGSGGYNDDGSLPANAQVLYITDKNKDKIVLDVITDSKGKKTPCTGLAAILAARQKGYDKTPLVLRVIGLISPPSGINSSGYLQVKGCYNVTLEGVGEDATIWKWGLLIREATNVEIRNLGIMWFPDDGISLDTNNKNIWVHNNDIFYGGAGGDADQAKGDGSADVKGFSNYITVSYNHFWDSGKSSLCGMGDSKEFFVTYHHNWFDHSDSRHPRVRAGSIHVYNNYYDGISKYGVGATMGSSVFVENNYFRNCKYPILISMQGSDCFNTTKQAYDYSDMPTFSKENGGMIKEFNNFMVGHLRFVNQNTTTDKYTNGHLQIDAYSVTSRDEKVPAEIKTTHGETSYNNFDTASTMYKYTADSPEVAKDKVMNYSGRINGGDFDWTFTAADDTSYAINTALYNKEKSYTPSVILDGDIKDDKEVTEIPTQKTSEASTETTTSKTSQSTTEAKTETTTEGVKEPQNGAINESLPYSLGDVNGDGFITAADAAVIKQYILNKKKLSLKEKELTAADVTGDGNITIDDANEIMTYVLRGKGNHLGKK